jgi:hypothetical protein
MKAFLAIALLLAASGTLARDLDGRYVNSPLHDWFMGLRSGLGPCCSDADGSVVADADWESREGHYRVRVMNEWWDVPDEAVVVEPNRYGRTMVWPIYIHGYSHDLLHKLDVRIRCFMPGAGM